MRSLLPFVGAVAVAYGVLCAWVFFTQRAQIYFPTPATDHPSAQVLWIEVQNERERMCPYGSPDYAGATPEEAKGKAAELFGVLDAEYPAQAKTK